MISIDRDRVGVPEALRGAQPRFSDPKVREALSKMQHGKCCYCEKKIATTGQGQAVDHFRPKAPSKYPELKDKWRNLLHACVDCNGAKGQQFPTLADETPLLIDPADPAIDPEDHITFEVNDEDDATFARAMPKDDSAFGKKTICVIKLDVVQRRRDRALYFKTLYEAYVDIISADPATRDSKIAAFQDLLGANHPYAAFGRAFARKKKLVKRFNVRIPAGADCE